MESNSKAGFTLVELMVVAIIVAILAAVAIPLMSGNKKRAMCTEAETALGAMRTQLRVMFAETSSYATNQNGVALNSASSVWQIPAVSLVDFQGKFWSTNAYSFLTNPVTMNGTNFVLQADGSQAGCDASLRSVKITIDVSGTITRSGL